MVFWFTIEFQKMQPLTLLHSTRMVWWCCILYTRTQYFLHTASGTHSRRASSVLLLVIFFFFLLFFFWHNRTIASAHQSNPPHQCVYVVCVEESVFRWFVNFVFDDRSQNNGIAHTQMRMLSTYRCSRILLVNWQSKALSSVYLHNTHHHHTHRKKLKYLLNMR